MGNPVHIGSTFPLGQDSFQGTRLMLYQTFHNRNPEWGLRDVEELRQLANTNELRLERLVRGRGNWKLPGSYLKHL